MTTVGRVTEHREAEWPTMTFWFWPSDVKVCAPRL